MEKVQWKGGKANGAKGYSVWKLLSSNFIPGFPGSARYYIKDKLLAIFYRRNCEECPSKKAISDGIRDILNFKGKYLTHIDYAGGAATIEFYCFVDALPEESQMVALEDYLHNASF